MTTPRRFVPWIFIPLLWLLAFGWNLTETVQLLFSVAFIPLAVVLGRRHGWHGTIAVAIGGIFLPLKIQIANGIVFSPADLDLYVVALAVSMMAADLFPWQRMLEFLRTRPLAWLLVVLLPLHLSLGEIVIGENGLRFEGDLYYVFWGALLLAGMSGVEWSILLLPAIGALLGFGRTLDAGYGPPGGLFGAGAVELPGFGLVRLGQFGWDYYVNEATSVGVMFAYFGAGRWLARARAGETTAPARWKTRLLVTGLALVGNLSIISQAVLREVDLGWLRYLNSEWAALVLAALLAGLWLGRGGVLWVTLVAVLPGAIRALASGHPAELGTLTGTAVTALAFGASGLLLRRKLVVVPPPAARDPFPWKDIALIAGAVGTLLPQHYFEDEETQAIAGGSLIGAALVAVVLFRFWWRRRRARNPGLESESAGWIALAALLAAAAAARDHFGTLKEQWAAAGQLREQLRELGPRPESSDYRETLATLLFMGAIAFAGLWTILTTVKTALENLRACAHDAQRALSRLARFFGWTQLAASLALPELPAEPETPAAPAKPAGLVRFMTYLNRGVAALVGVALLALAFVGFRESLRGESAFREEPRATALPPAARAQPDAALLQAARDFAHARGLGIAQEEAAAYPVVLTTRWQIDPAAANRRERYVIEVGATPESVDVRVETQERHGFLWFAKFARHASREAALGRTARDAILGRPAPEAPAPEEVVVLAPFATTSRPPARHR